MESLTNPPGATTSHLPPITAHSRRDRGNLTRHGVRWRPLFPHSRVCVAVYKVADIDEAIQLGDRVAILNVGGVLEQWDV